MQNFSDFIYLLIEILKSLAQHALSSAVNISINSMSGNYRDGPWANDQPPTEIHSFECDIFS